MNFSEILCLMKAGHEGIRKGWNGKDITVFLYHPSVTSMTDEQLEDDTVINPQFRIWDRRRKRLDSWVPSVSDILATDWEAKIKM